MGLKESWGTAMDSSGGCCTDEGNVEWRFTGARFECGGTRAKGMTGEVLQGDLAGKCEVRGVSDDDV